MKIGFRTPFGLSDGYRVPIEYEMRYAFKTIRFGSTIKCQFMIDIPVSACLPPLHHSCLCTIPMALNSLTEEDSAAVCAARGKA